MVGRWISFWENIFAGAMLVLGSVEHDRMTWRWITAENVVPSILARCWRLTLNQDDSRKNPRVTDFDQKKNKNWWKISGISNFNFHEGKKRQPSDAIGISAKNLVLLFCYCWWFRNPAPVDMVNTPLFTGFDTSQVVQNFFHQQYQPPISYLKRNLG